MIDINVNELVGKVVTKVKVSDDKSEITFATEDGGLFKLYHSQDCCESVNLYDIVGDLDDLVGDPILEAEEVTSNEHPAGYASGGYEGSFTWTFYKFGTRKGRVTLRWLGESNGYYSESVDFVRIK